MSDKAAIVFYSRTGATRKLAATLAAELSAETGEIRCPRFRPGGLRYLLAGYHSVKGNLPAIESPAIGLSAYDLVLLGTPVWTSHPSLPMRSFLTRKPHLPDDVAVFLTFGGHSPAEKAIAELNELLPRPPVATLAVSQSDVLQDNHATAVDRFLDELKQGKAAAG